MHGTLEKRCGPGDAEAGGTELGSSVGALQACRDVEARRYGSLEARPGVETRRHGGMELWKHAAGV